MSCYVVYNYHMLYSISRPMSRHVVYITCYTEYIHIYVLLCGVHHMLYSIHMSCYVVYITHCTVYNYMSQYENWVMESNELLYDASSDLL